MSFSHEVSLSEIVVTFLWNDIRFVPQIQNSHQTSTATIFGYPRPINSVISSFVIFGCVIHSRLIVRPMIIRKILLPIVIPVLQAPRHTYQNKWRPFSTYSRQASTSWKRMNIYSNWKRVCCPRVVMLPVSTFVPHAFKKCKHYTDWLILLLL